MPLGSDTQDEFIEAEEVVVDGSGADDFRKGFAMSLPEDCF